MKNAFLLFFLLFVTSSCGDQKIDTTKARQEMEAREIKRVSEGEIVEKALAWGNELTAEVDVALMVEDTEDGEVAETLLSVSVPKEIPFHYDFVTYEDIKTFKGKKFEIFDAFKYAFENSVAAEPSVQILEGDSIILYTREIYHSEFPGVFYIDFPKKEIVLSIKK